MTETGQLAPHQQRLAELVASRKSLEGAPSTPGDPERAVTDGWKAALRHDPSTTISGLQRTLDDHRAGAGRSAVLAQLAMHFSENNDRATPEDPEAARWCDYCGNSDDLEPGADGPDRPELACRDLDACVANRERRYPPDMARVPQWIFDAQARIMDQDTASTLEASIAQACREFCIELTAAIEAEEIALAAAREAEQLELAQPWYWGTAGGAYDVHGTVRVPVPAPPAQNFNWANWNWRHTIRGGAPMHRTIANQQLTPARIAAQAAVSQARGAQRAQQPSPGSAGGGQGGGQTAPTGVPEGVRAAIQGDAQAADIQLQQQGVHPDALPNRTPAQAQAARRRGPKLRYSAGPRKRKPKHDHPGVDGSDSFGNSPDTGGPDGSASSAEVTG
jgi:hypothetical protein